MQNKKKKMLGGYLAAMLTLTTVLAPAQALAAQPEVKFNVEAVAQSLRLAGADRYETAAKIAKDGWSQSEYAVLAAGTDANLVDSITAAPLAKQLNAPILLTEGSSLNSYTEAELVRLGVKTVYVTTGTGVISQSVLDRLTALGIETVKLGGSDRFETSINIAKQLKPFNKLVVTTAWTNADALSVAAIAAQKGSPILLTDVNQLPADVSSYINSVKSEVSGTYVLGGTGAVAETVKNALPSAVRLGGSDRFDTNVQILKYFAKTLNYGKSYLANGEDSHLVDALAVSPLAAQAGSPVVLTGGTLPAGTEAYFKANLTPNVVALGGETVVSNAVVSDLTSCLVYDVEGSVQGAASETTPAQIAETVVLQADDLTLQNANLAGSVLVQGDNAKLKNLHVDGTVFINVGSTGTVSLDNVTAANIVVISGTKYGTYTTMADGTSVRVNLSNSQASALMIQGDGQTDLYSEGNSFDDVFIGGQSAVVLNGDYDTVTVVGSATITATYFTRITNLVIDSDSRNDVITLNGTFDNVVLNAYVQFVLGSNAVVKNLVMNSNSSIKLSPSAQIIKLDKNGHTVTGDDSTSPGSSGGSSGGGPTAPSITGITSTIATVHGSDIVLRANPTNIRSASITVSQDSTLKLQVKQGTNWLTLAEWNLDKGSNSFLSLDNMVGIDFANTLEALKQSGLDAEDIMEAINFNGLLQALPAPGSDDDELIYGNDGIVAHLTDILTGGSNLQAVYDSLKLNEIYSAADEDIQQAIRDGLADAVANFDNDDVTVDALVGEDNEARQLAISTVVESDSTVSFFKDINFATIFSAMAAADADTKQDIFDAVDFNAVFTAVRDGYGSGNQATLYGHLALALGNAFNLSTDTKDGIRDAVEYDELVYSVIHGYPAKGVRLNLTNAKSAAKNYYLTITTED